MKTRGTTSSSAATSSMAHSLIVDLRLDCGAGADVVGGVTVLHKAFSLFERVVRIEAVEGNLKCVWGV
jgi:hypothetical protein